MQKYGKDLAEEWVLGCISGTDFREKVQEGQTHVWWFPGGQRDHSPSKHKECDYFNAKRVPLRGAAGSRDSSIAVNEKHKFS